MEFLGAVFSLLFTLLFISLFFKILSSILSYTGKSYATIKGEAGERQVNQLLSRLNREKYQVYHDLYVPMEGNKSTQIDHVVVSPYGIFVIETKNFKGWIFGDDRSHYWTQVIYKRKEKFFNPIWQNDGHIKALETYLNLDKNLFTSIIAFSNQTTFKYKEEFTRAKVIHFRWLLQAINLQDEVVLSDEQLQTINQMINSLVITENEIKQRVHHEHVHRLKQNGEESKVISLIQEKCPECESELGIRTGKHGAYLACSRYPKCRYTRRMRHG